MVVLAGNRRAANIGSCAPKAQGSAVRRRCQPYSRTAPEKSAALTPYIDAFFPSFGLILLGHLLRRRVLTDAAFWSGVERLVFYVLSPALLAVSIGGVDLSVMPVGTLAIAILAGLLGGLALCTLAWKPLGLDFAAYTSLVQGGIRFNSFLGLALATALFGNAGLALGAVLTGLIVPAVNTILVLVFALGGGRQTSMWRFLLTLLTNPLILGCAAGYAFSLAGGMPHGIGPFLRTLGSATIPLGLMTVGAALTLPGMRLRVPAQVSSWIIKLALVPTITVAMGRLLGLDATATLLAALFIGLPTATTSYVTARQLGGDAPFMAAIITSQHIVAIVTLPLLIALLG